jgi:probable phosphoglycerate mutase
LVVLLIRHAHTHAVGRFLAGRDGDVPLSTKGLQQAEHLRDSLAGVTIHAVYSSPLRRAVATAEPLARDRGRSVTVRHDLQEVDFGEWTGLSFPELERQPRWRAFNERRSSVSVPGGESMDALSARIVGALDAVRRNHPDERVAVVTHAEVIRAAVLTYRGISWDRFHEIDIAPASVTTVILSRSSARILTVSSTPGIPAALGPI